MDDNYLWRVFILLQHDDTSVRNGANSLRRRCGPPIIELPTPRGDEAFGASCAQPIEVRRHVAGHIAERQRDAPHGVVVRENNGGAAVTRRFGTVGHSGRLRDGDLRGSAIR